MAEPFSWTEWAALPPEERKKKYHHRQLGPEDRTPEEQAWLDAEIQRLFKAEISS
jgi:hypothetical protein